MSSLDLASERLGMYGLIGAESPDSSWSRGMSRKEAPAALWVDIGFDLRQAVSGSKDLFFAAPFITGGALRSVLSSPATGVGRSLTVVTRWRPEEVAAGVSDLSVMDVVQEHSGELLLLDRLHAKYYGIGEESVLGSANLTSRGLGWHAASNLELVTRLPARLMDFEAAISREAIPATNEIRARVLQAAAAFPKVRRVRETVLGPEVGSISAPAFGGWLPVSLRHPARLFGVYGGESEDLSSGAVTDAHADIDGLEIPSGIHDEAAFNMLVRERLLQSGTSLMQLREFARTRRRFGEMVRFVMHSSEGLSRDEAVERWQTLMRWLLHFFPDEVECVVFNHSETFLWK
jgi:hypothetical protein